MVRYCNCHLRIYLQENIAFLYNVNVYNHHDVCQKFWHTSFLLHVNVPVFLIGTFANF